MQVDIQSNRQSCRGSTPVIIICSMLILVIISALAADVGYVAFEQYRLAKTARDAASLGAGLLMENKDVKKQVTQYIIHRANELDKLNVDISENKKDISIELIKPVKYNFLKLFKIYGRLLDANATARISTACQVKGIRPFAVQKGSFQPGQEKVLTDNTAVQEGFTRFIPIKLKDGYYKLSVMYGYNHKLNIGDGIYGLAQSQADTALKAMQNIIVKHPVTKDSGKRRTDADKNVILLPVVDKLDPSGQTIMNIVGFAPFRVDDARMENSKLFIKGRFVRYIIDTLTSDSIDDFGLSGIQTAGR